ncbi:hypothetical protein H5410_049980 [Solanum commersonii]|uniref:Uncharacterized protein n=1 Tax=Solanum commersonii TaxID=4109 RepID=A0A9J5WU70_SOLCO|nr:hypothetical protein H5410_049980 [Solanum commersonii]
MKLTSKSYFIFNEVTRKCYKDSVLLSKALALLSHLILLSIIFYTRLQPVKHTCSEDEDSKNEDAQMDVWAY